MRDAQKKLGKLVLGVCLLLLFSVKDAHAYIDLGSASYVFQLLIAGLLGSVFVIKLYWGKITTFLSGLFKKNSEGQKND